jgi:hypothetical protein
MFLSPPRTTSWAKLNRPYGTACKFAVLTQTLKPIVFVSCMYGLKPVPFRERRRATKHWTPANDFAKTDNSCHPVSPIFMDNYSQWENKKRI